MRFWMFSVIQHRKMPQKSSIMFVRSLAIVSITHCLLGVAESEKAKLEELNVQCREENHLKQEELDFLKDRKYVETTDERIKCYVKCMLSGLNLMDEAGNFPAEANPEQMSKYGSHYLACKDVTGSNLCDKALNFQNCIWKERALQDTSAY